MKKVVLIAVMAFIGYSAAAQGEFRAGVSAGLPTGNLGDWYSFAASVDTEYTWSVSDNFRAGAATGYTHYFGSDGAGDFKYAPIAAVASFQISDGWYFDAQGGYAISLNVGGSGDLYFRGSIGYDVSSTIRLRGGYRGVSGNGSTLGDAHLGLIATF